MRFLQIFNVGSLPHVEDWPVFRQVARTHGIVSSLSVPLYGAGRAIGTVNLYSRERNAFEDCESVAMNFASHAAATLTTIQE
jgi:GAF domain-containing protein